MRVGDARAAAIDWVCRHGRALPGYRGAYFAGSTVGHSGDTELPVGSDVDTMVVDSDAPKPGKFSYRDCLLEVSFVPWTDLMSADAVLGNYHLAHGFRTDTIVDDPTGHLRTLQSDVESRFADESAVRLRCANATSTIVDRLAGIEPDAPFHNQVLGWLFGTGVTTHVLLVAALRNPTVRLRYMSVREVLVEHQRHDRYRDLLELLGVADMTRDQVEHHLTELAATFDATAAVARTPFAHRSDITPAARPVAIDGAADLVRRGDHREAVFWIVATFARCHAILAADAPGLQASLAPTFRSAVADLGITDYDGMVRQRREVMAYLPELDAIAEAIIENSIDGGRILRR